MKFIKQKLINHHKITTFSLVWIIILTFTGDLHSVEEFEKYALFGSNAKRPVITEPITTNPLKIRKMTELPQLEILSSTE